MKENIIRICCFMLGVTVTLGTVLIRDQVTIKKQEKSEVSCNEEESATDDYTELVREVESTADDPYEKEADERMQQLKDEEAKKQEEKKDKEEKPEKSASENALTWDEDFPFIDSTISLENREKERSSYEETMAMNAFDKKVIADSDIDFSDVKIAILGDSLTAASNLTEAEQKKYAYPVILQEILGAKEVLNLGIGGSTVSSCSNSYPMVERWSDIPRDTDIIIVFGGSNDCLFENKWQFGNIEYDLRMNKDTFCGDLDRMASAMKYSFLDTNTENQSKMFFVNPPSTILNDGVYNVDPGNMVHQRSFAEAINAIVPSYEFDVIDMYNNNLLNSHDKEVYEKLVTDGIHPNPEGYRIIAEHLASQIIQRVVK